MVYSSPPVIAPDPQNPVTGPLVNIALRKISAGMRLDEIAVLLGVCQGELRIKLDSPAYASRAAYAYRIGAGAMRDKALFLLEILIADPEQNPVAAKATMELSASLRKRADDLDPPRPHAPLPDTAATSATSASARRLSETIFAEVGKPAATSRRISSESGTDADPFDYTPQEDP